MAEMVIGTKALPEPLLRLIHTGKAKVLEANGEVRLVPIAEKGAGCPFFGMFADGKISSERFIAEKNREKELER